MRRWFPLLVALIVLLVLPPFLLGIYVLVAAWPGSGVATPLVQPAATSAPRARPTPTLSCEEALWRECGELSALYDEMMAETTPLCRVKGDAWCVEALVDLGNRARNVNAPACGLEAQRATIEFFRQAALARTMQGDERQRALERAMDALDTYGGYCVHD
jgi:hypothetical protein